MSLTNQQSKVRELILSGRTNKQIAKVLGISDSTVKLHASAIYKKEGVRSRAQLIAYDKSGQKVTPVPVTTEQKPICWIHRHGEKVMGIMFTENKPKDGWEPLYFKEKKT